MAPIRKCSKEGCPSQNTSPDVTWYCYCCKNPIHLLCYGVLKAPEEIFVMDNITMICDECLSNPIENLSPRRKRSASVNFVQSTIDMRNPILSLSKTAIAVSTPSKNGTMKSQIQTVMESLVQKVETQTVTIAGLQASVETMNDTILQQKVAVGESIKANNENISSLQKSLNQTPVRAYANVVKQGLPNRAVNGTPRSSRPKQTPRFNKPVLSGTSTHLIGKPISPTQLKRNDRPKAPPKPEKAVWISRLHRETSEEELALYIKNSIGITSADITVRKLVKKDRDISTYSFVSFRVTCSASNFATLMDPTCWPSSSQIREFELEQGSSVGVRLSPLSTKAESKNGEPSANVIREVGQTPKEPTRTTIQPMQTV